MNSPKCRSEDYINFLVATPKVCSATEAARAQPQKKDVPAHDAFTHLLARLNPNPIFLWYEARQQVRLNDGILVVDDTVIDKPYAKNIALIGKHWSGKHKRVVQGISLVTTLWSDGKRRIPVDYRIYCKEKDALTKNGHFRQMLKIA